MEIFQCDTAGGLLLKRYKDGVYGIVLQKINEAFENAKLQRKLAILYGVITGIFLVVTVFIMHYVMDMYNKKLYEKSQQELDYFTQNVNDEVNAVFDQSYTLAVDTEIQTILAEMAALGPSWEYIQKQEKLRFILQSEIKPDSPLKCIIYTDKNKIRMEEGISFGTIPEELYDGFIKKIHEAKGAAVMQSPTKEYPYLMIGRDVRNRLDMSLDDLGTLLFICDTAELIQKYEDNLEAEHAALFVYSEDGSVYKGAEMKPELPSLEKDMGYQIIRHQDEKYFMCYQKSEETGWMYVNIFPYSDFLKQIRRIRQVIVIGFATAFMAAMVLMNWLTHVITKPLEELTASIQIVETGDFKGAKQRIGENQRKDEVGLLTDEFLLMLDKIDLLIYENYEKQLLLQETKYKMLQAQINPHFLYNTLNAINWMVKAGSSEKAGKMVVELGQLLRASFAANPYATANEEIHMVESYIEIQKIRYQNRADFMVKTSGNLENYMVPRMILQPLVENSINYGADCTLSVCHIFVSACEQKDQLKFTVEDDGPGMSEEELQAVRTFTIQPKGHGIGLKNIYERLQIIYDDFSFEIWSKEGNGTRVEICVPKMERMKQNV